MADIFKMNIPKGATFEEMQTIIRKELSQPDFELQIDVYEQFVSLNNFEEQTRHEIIEIIGPLYNELKDKTDRESLKRKDELQDIAYFIKFLDKGVKLISMGESPDFIIEFNGERIGLEHTRIVDKDAIARVSTLERICVEIQNELGRKYPEIKLHLSLRFDDKEIAGMKRANIYKIVYGFIEQYLADTNTPLPSIINKIVSSPHSQLDIRLSEGYRRKDVETEEFNKLIAQKESKLATYKGNGKVEKVWLLANVDGASEKSDPTLNPALMPNRKFGFDKVFVFNAMTGLCLGTLE